MPNRKVDERSGERGAVLVWTLWLLLVVSSIALISLRQTLTANEIMQARVTRTQMRLAAEAAIYETLHTMLIQAKGQASQLSAPKRNLTINGQMVEVTIENELGKIDINPANEDLLSAVFASHGVSEEKATSIAAAIMDWRDSDELRRPNGAESLDYRRNDSDVLPRNSNFETLGEILRVKGMTPALLRCVRPLLTIYSGSSVVDISSASDAVKNVFSWADKRHWKDRSWPTGEAGGNVLSPFASVNGTVFRLQADVQPQGFLLEIYVRLTGGGGRQFNILEQHEIFQDKTVNCDFHS